MIFSKSSSWRDVSKVFLKVTLAQKVRVKSRRMPKTQSWKQHKQKDNWKITLE